MDSSSESGSWTATDSDEDDSTEEEVKRKTPDRSHVDSLLDISEASTANESRYEVYVKSAWEEAKPEDDHRADLESSAANYILAEDKTTPFPKMHLERSSRSPSTDPGSKTELHGSKDKEKAGVPTVSDNKETERAKQPVPREALSKLAYIKFAMQCPLEKEKGIMKRLGGIQTLGAGRVEGTEILPDADRATIVPQDSCLSLTIKSYRSPIRKKLLPEFTISMPKRCGSPVRSLHNSASQAAHHRRIKSDTPIKQALIINSQGDNWRRTQPRIPAILGTRLPLVTAPSRI
ncbi:hypothetical protein JZ751_027211, partial [Albula glossodonta]